MKADRFATGGRGRRSPEAPPFGKLRALALCAVLAVLLCAVLLPNFPTYDHVRLGDVAARTYRSPRDFTFESAVQTERKRDAAAEAVADVIGPAPGVYAEQLKLFDESVRQIDGVRANTLLDVTQKVEAVSGVTGEGVTSQDVLLLLALTDDQWGSVVSSARALLKTTLLGYVQQSDIPSILADLPARVTGVEESQKDLTAHLVAPYIVPNQVVNVERTQAERQAARDNVLPVRVTLNEGQVIAPQGQQISEDTLEIMAAAGLLDATYTLQEMLAMAGIAVVIAAFLGAFLLVFQPGELRGTRRQALIISLLVGVALATKLLLPIALPDLERRGLEFALPVAVAGMLAAALIETRIGLFIAALAAIVVTFGSAYAPSGANFPPNYPLDSLRMMLVFFLGGVAGVLGVHRAERFSRYLLAGFGVGLATWVVLALFWLIDSSNDYESLAWMTGAAGMNGLISAVITLGSFVFLSTAFGITTRLQLMELAQLNAPLMRRLQDEAPGTFHHSIIVSNLGERAADLIGADSLLVRVGCYYHDIGKVMQPAFYIENQLTGDNPHDHLDPYTSAKIITDHVRNGIELERRHGIPRVVQQFTQQHHGTRLAAYFYRQAAVSDPDLDPAPFQYPGPRPQTKEAAIVMLADSVEATVRAARDRSQRRIDEIVEDVIGERLAEGQLDESDLTLREVRVIADSFKSTLRAVYHPRIEYPPATAGEMRGPVTAASEAAVSARGVQDDNAVPLLEPIKLEERTRGRKAAGEE